MSTSTLEDIDLELMIEFSTEESEPCVCIENGKACPLEAIVRMILRRLCDCPQNNSVPVCLRHKEFYASSGTEITCNLCGAYIEILRFEAIR
jgi:hypothetical protein